MGVSLSHTGHRETGLERGEYDQGQHDQIRRVLAVNTAGMLVRRDVVERLGFDRALPVAGADIDFGWRAARAGYTTIVAPDAVVFHAEAAHRGLRASTITRHMRRSERCAAHYILATNVSARWLPLLLLRMVVFGLLRAAGLLLIRAPAEAWDELAALLLTVARPWRIVAGRFRRRRTSVLTGREIATLLPPWWLPLRTSLDHALEAARALFALTFSSTEPAVSWEVEEEEEPDVTDGAFVTVVRVLTSRALLVGTALTIAAVFAARGLIHGVPVGGALPPVLNGPAHLWSTYLESWHLLGTGTAAPVTPYVLPLAAAGAVLGGHVDWVVQILLLLSVPLAALGALRLGRRLLDSGPLVVWAAVTYGLVPVATGSVQQGRLGTVVFLLVLPHLAFVLIDLIGHPDRDRRRRAMWRAALWLALAGAFAPVVIVLAFAALVVAVLVMVPAAGGPGLRAVLPAVGAVLAALVLLAPWSLTVWYLGDPLSWLREAGWQAPELIGSRGPWDLLLGRPATVGALPGWLSVGVLAAALAALLRTTARAATVTGWAVAVFGLVAAAAMSYLRVVPVGGTQALPLWPGVPTGLAFAALIFTAAMAGAGGRAALSGRSFGWGQPVAVVVVLAALAAPLVTLGYWVHLGSGGPLTVQPSRTVPVYMLQAGKDRATDGTLQVEGGPDDFSYVLLHGYEVGLGDESVLPDVAAQRPLTAAVADLLAQPTEAAAGAVAGFGVRYVYLPPPADPALSASFDSATGAFSPASALRVDSRAWELSPPPSTAELSPAPDPYRSWMVGGQLVALFVVVILAAPSRRRSR